MQIQTVGIGELSRSPVSSHGNGGDSHHHPTCANQAAHVTELLGCCPADEELFIPGLFTELNAMPSKGIPLCLLPWIRAVMTSQGEDEDERALQELNMTKENQVTSIVHWERQREESSSKKRRHSSAAPEPQAV
ncbi:hypothetical protein DPEC_G00114200 [Dallia pectoralis]|uniref:Uncharacterized protein n=1 Tax=Dallia pectoralis TaxID=75939 RepID=A0ACC2GTT0_DALPE|nr:hypothetical protein DPEC_G00114200 [Dallia pectoralis]